MPPREALEEASDGVRADLSRLARDSGLTLAGAVANAVFGFLLVVVVTRGLGADRSGVFFEAIALFSIVSVVGGLGAGDGVVRMLARYRAVGRTADLRRILAAALVPVLVVGPVLGVAMFALAPRLSDLFVHGESHAGALVPYIRVLAPFVGLSALSVTLLAATRGFGTMVPFVVVDNLGKPALRPVLALAAILLGLGATGLALSWALPIAAGLAVAAVAVIRSLERAERLDPPGHPRARGEVAGEFWRFAFPRGVAAALAIGLSWIDTLLVGGLRGVRDAGVYAATTRYIVVGTVMIQAVQLAVAPVLGALFGRGERDRAQTVYRAATQWLVLGGWPIYLTLAVFGPVLLRAFGREFVAGQTALVVLSLAALVVTAAGPSQTALLMAGKSGWTLINATFSLGINVVLNLVLIPRLGIDGAALAWMASLVFNNVVGLLELRFLLGLSPFGTGFPEVALAAAACFGGLGWLVRAALGLSLPSLLVFGVVGTGAYTAVLWKVRSRLNLPVLREALRARRGPAKAQGPEASITVEGRRL
jgi:O-antigen/teichoic acid export membrane protein